MNRRPPSGDHPDRPRDHDHHRDPDRQPDCPNAVPDSATAEGSVQIVKLRSGGDLITDEAEPVEEVKVCRGYGEQMPKTCPTCWQKTTAYCGTCRKTQPATRRRAPGETQILANGLPKLLPGQLERLVLDVIRTQQLPDHLGITGWTAGRVAIFLPGRSTGAIGNALDKLAATGQAALLGHDPKCYGPIPTEELAADQPDTPGDADQQR